MVGRMMKMDCRKVREAIIKCLGTKDLPGADVIAHVKECTECSARLADWEAISREITGIYSLQPSTKPISEALRSYRGAPGAGRRPGSL